MNTTQTTAVASEWQRGWRNDMERLANLLASHLPAYKNLIASYEAKSKN